MLEFDLSNETDLEGVPSLGRLIQDFTVTVDSNNNRHVNVYNVYEDICQIMSDNGFAGKNGECLATFSTVGKPPRNETPGPGWHDDCTSFYYGEPPMVEKASELLHAFAGDFFGGLATIAINLGIRVTQTDTNFNCTTRNLKNTDNLGQLISGGPSQLTDPSRLTHTPAVIDAHGYICSVGPTGGCYTDPNSGPIDPGTGANQYAAQAFFDDLYNLAHNSHTRIADNTSIPKLPATTYPVVIGETFTNQESCPELPQVTGGATAEGEGYLSSNNFSNFDPGFIFRPWHIKASDPSNRCPTPAQIGDTAGPYHPYSTWKTK